MVLSWNSITPNDVWETRIGQVRRREMWSIRSECPIGSASPNARAFGGRADRGAVNKDYCEPDHGRSGLRRLRLAR